MNEGEGESEGEGEGEGLQRVSEFFAVGRGLPHA